MALDLKGLEIGKAIDCGRMASDGRMYGGSCDPDGDPARMNWDTTLLGYKTVIHVRIDPPTGAIESVTTQEFEFDDVRAALTKKFGEPQCSRRLVSSAYGVNFSQEMCHWDGSDSYLMLTKNHQKMGDQLLTLGSQKQLRALQASRAKAASDI